MLHPDETLLVWMHSMPSIPSAAKVRCDVDDTDCSKFIVNLGSPKADSASPFRGRARLLTKAYSSPPILRLP